MQTGGQYRWPWAHPVIPSSSTRLRKLNNTRGMIGFYIKSHIFWLILLFLNSMLLEKKRGLWQSGRQVELLDFSCFVSSFFFFFLTLSWFKGKDHSKLLRNTYCFVEHPVFFPQNTWTSCICFQDFTNRRVMVKYFGITRATMKISIQFICCIRLWIGL